MIYLSWSLVQLIAVLVGMWIPYLINLKLKIRKVTFKRYLCEWLLTSLFVLFLAFDVGTRQEHLQRSSFDATVPIETMDKQDRSTLDRNTVKQTFENAVKTTK
jgi:hypothetical protein